MQFNESVNDSHSIASSSVGLAFGGLIGLGAGAFVFFVDEAAADASLLRQTKYATTPAATSSSPTTDTTMITATGDDSSSIEGEAGAVTVAASTTGTTNADQRTNPRWNG